MGLEVLRKSQSGFLPLIIPGLGEHSFNQFEIKIISFVEDLIVTDEVSELFPVRKRGISYRH